MRLALLVGLSTSAMAAEHVTTFPSRPGVTLSMLVITPEAAPQGSLLIYVGGGGAIGLRPDRNPGQRGGNFLFRVADQLAATGYVVGILDNPSDSPSAVWNQRSSESHAQDSLAALKALRSLAAGPAWIIGTSMGTVSAANAAARLSPAQGGPDGIVLTSSISATSRNTNETVLTVPLDNIRVPVLVVAHQDDACFASPAAAAQRIRDEAQGAPRSAILLYKGGKPPESGPCEPFAPHGFFGIEAQVVADIINWITAAPSKSE
ncbi:alpha/beta hydrolase [Paramagnetospirillum marisnigri]|nr:alpha/beta hydrolase [Paramagnetospirillum marisnigri]